MDRESYVTRFCWRVILTGILAICFRMGGIGWWNVVGIALGHFVLTGQLDQIFLTIYDTRYRN